MRTEYLTVFIMIYVCHSTMIQTEDLSLNPCGNQSSIIRSETIVKTLASNSTTNTSRQLQATVNAKQQTDISLSLQTHNHSAKTLHYLNKTSNNSKETSNKPNESLDNLNETSTGTLAVFGNRNDTCTVKYTKNAMLKAKSTPKRTSKRVKNKTRRGRPTKNTPPSNVPHIYLHEINRSLLMLRPTQPTTPKPTLPPNVTRKTRTTLYITPFTRRPGTTKEVFGCPICYKVFRKGPRLQLHMNKAHNLSIHVTIRRWMYTQRGAHFSYEDLDVSGWMKQVTMLGNVEYDLAEGIENANLFYPKTPRSKQVV